MTDHPITPPPELQEEWLGLWPQDALLQAARWGADQELEACCEWLKNDGCHTTAIELGRARRPKPLSLAEEALETLMQVDGADLPVPVLVLLCDEVAKIRRALERLQELEGQSDG